MRNFGLKVGIAGTVKFEARIRELVENLPELAALVEPLLIVRRVLHEQISVLHRRLLAIVRGDAVCRRLMTIPGVGPVVALTYRATIDVPARFKRPFRNSLSCVQFIEQRLRLLQIARVEPLGEPAVHWSK
jgi:transposase